MAPVLAFPVRIVNNFFNRRVFAAAAFTAVLAACGSEGSSTGPVTPPPAPTAGWLTVQVNTPRNDDGAIQLSVSGPGVDSARIVGYDGFVTVSATGADLIATGNMSNGTVAQIHVPNIARSAEYQVAVVAAAARDTYALQDLNGYRAVIVH